MYKKLLLVLLVLILVNSADASREGDWLVNQGTNGVWSNMRETAYGVLALDQETIYGDEIANGVESLIGQLESCMASNSCNVKDASIATLALHERGNNAIIVNKAGSWLLNSRSVNFKAQDLPSTGNEWFVQVVSSTAGSCDLVNLEDGSSVVVPVNLNLGYNEWYNILPSSNVLTSTTESLNLDCSGLGTDLVLSFINKKDISSVENYFIKREERDDNITVSFGDPCWSQSYRSGSCDTETSGYVLYVLDEIGKSGDPSWLIEQTSLGILEQAFLFKVTQDSQYLTSLTSGKNAAGYWGNADLPLTALVYSLLKPDGVVNGVENWVASRRDSASCWEKPSCSVEDTALVLYSGSFLGIEAGCPDLDEDNICDRDDNDIDGDGLLNSIDRFDRNPDENNNNVLDGDEDLDGDGFADKEDNDIDGDGVANSDDEDPWDETVGRDTTVDPDRGGTTIGNSCTTEEGCEGRRDAIGQCIDISGDGCPRSDRDDGFDDDFGGGSTGGTPPSSRDVEEDGSSVVLWSLLVLLLLIALGGGGFLAYKKGLLKFKFGKKKPKPEAKYTPKLSTAKRREAYSPRLARRIPKVAKGIGKDLDDSMKELEKLIGKK